MYEYRCILDLDEKMADREVHPGNFLGEWLYTWVLYSRYMYLVTWGLAAV
jgi:hypothetical protein